MKNKSTGTERNYGIDLLRMVAMFMVIILHILFKGGVIPSYETKSADFETAWFLEIAALCAVNCYALISGYVGYNAKYRYSNIINLWLRVLFYTITITAAFAYFLPQTVGTTQWIGALFPATTRQYWYFTAYLGLFIFIPLLNQGVRNLNQGPLKLVLAGMFILFSLQQTISQTDVFSMNKGYSSFWLLPMYILGAYIRKYDALHGVTIPKALSGYLGMVILTWGTRLILEFTTLHFLGEQKWECILVEYTSPTILAAAVFLFALFEKLPIRGDGTAARVITFFSASSFSVYIIHANPLVWVYIIANRFKDYTTLSLPVMVLSVLGTALAIYLLCTLLDLVRRLLSTIVQKTRQGTQKAMGYSYRK